MAPAVSVLILLFGLLAPPLARPAWAQQQGWPEELTTAFLDACASSSGLRAICSCVLDRLQQRYSLEELAGAVRRAQTTGQLP